MMTRKDYVATAEILNGNRSFIHPATFATLVEEFATMFENDNPNFHYERFENACNGKAK
jgi:hypothetical protein